MTELEREGVGLATKVLYIIAALAVILLAIVSKSEFNFVPMEVQSAQKILETVASVPNPSPDVVDKVVQAMQKINDARQASRMFWKDILQTILVNIFLPVLTAILGYIFGTSRGAGNGGRPVNGM